MAFDSAEAVTFEIAKSRAAHLGKRMARRWGTTRSKAALDLAISKANNSMPGRSQTRTFRKNRNMNTYKIDLTEDGSTLRINWGDPATNETIVWDSDARLVQLEQSGQLIGAR